MLLGGVRSRRASLKGWYVGFWWIQQVWDLGIVCIDVVWRAPGLCVHGRVLEVYVGLLA